MICKTHEAARGRCCLKTSISGLGRIMAVGLTSIDLQDEPHARTHRIRLAEVSLVTTAPERRLTSWV